MAKRPNYLFVITDQQRADYLGCTGHPLLKTPHIDSIAARGSRFNRCYVSSPVCMPNRAALMTGRMTSVNGVRQNGNDLPRHMTTFTEVLMANGYDTALLGKSHLQTMTEFPTPIGSNPAGTGALANAINIGDASQYASENERRWRELGYAAVDLPYYGFQQAEIVTFHGDNTGGAHDVWLRERVDDPDAIRGPAHQLAHDYRCPQAVRTAMPEALYSTTFIKEKTQAFLTEPKRHDNPFFAFVSFPDPHHPFTPPGKYWDMYDPQDMPLPIDATAHQNPPPHLQWVRDQPRAEGTGFRTDALDLSNADLKEAVALTCGMIAMIDDAVGDILSTLADNGLADNTILIFTSDHGDYLGHHGLLLKGGLHFDSLTRVPLLWFDPHAAHQPRDINTLCSTIDLAPTILARAGASPYAGIQGLDLTPLVTGDKTTLERNGVLIEEDTYFADILGFDGQVRQRTYRRDHWRLSVFHGEQWGELYDLDADPGETRNLWDDPAYASAKQELIWELLQSQLGYVDRSPWPKYEA